MRSPHGSILSSKNWSQTAEVHKPAGGQIVPTSKDEHGTATRTDCPMLGTVRLTAVS